MKRRNGAPVVPTGGGSDEDRLVLRTEAAEIIGKSVATLRRLEQTELQPASVDEAGVHWHSVRRLREYKAKRVSAKLGPNHENAFDGVTAAEAFEQFDRGANAADVVKSLHVVPAVARQLQREWADLRGVFIIGGEVTVKIRERFADDENPAETGEDFLRLLEQELERPKCECCKRRERKICLRCFEQRPPEALQIVAAARAASDARRAARAQKAIETLSVAQAYRSSKPKTEKE